MRSIRQPVPARAWRECHSVAPTQVCAGQAGALDRANASQAVLQQVALMQSLEQPFFARASGDAAQVCAGHAGTPDQRK